MDVLPSTRNGTKSVVTVGPRSYLPSIYVENEVSGGLGTTNLRYRNRILDVHGNTLQSTPYPMDRSRESSFRSTPSYGTPGTSASMTSWEDQDTPDSGFECVQARPDSSYLAKSDSTFQAQLDTTFIVKPRHFFNPDGTYIEREPEEVSLITTTHGLDVEPTYPGVENEQAKIKASLEDLQRRWRHHQRKAALFGTKEAFADLWESMSDLDSVKEVLPLVVTTIIIASCIVAVCMLSGGLVRDPSASKLGSNMNGKYKSIEFGRNRLTEKLERSKRMPPVEIKDENGVILGGKKASIQFAYDLRTKLESGKEVVVEDAPVENVAIEEAEVADGEGKSDNDGDNEVLEELSIKVASKVADLYGKLSREPAANSKDEAKRQELLNKLGLFGHFATTKIGPQELNLDSDDPAPQDQPEPAKVQSVDPPTNDDSIKPKLDVEIKVAKTGSANPAKPVKKPKEMAKRSPKEDPFKAFMKPEAKKSKAKKVEKDEDDPFRIVPKNPVDSEDDPFRIVPKAPKDSKKISTPAKPSKDEPVKTRSKKEVRSEH